MPDSLQKELIKIIYSKENLYRIDEDKRRYMILNGRVKDTIREAIEKEFLLPETVRELINRVIPLNITEKIVSKLATVYKESPNREDAFGSESDNDLIDFYSKIFNLNHKMIGGNILLKTTKHYLIEMYAHKGMPKIRNLPSHTYTPFSFDEVEPETPTGFVKHLILGSKDAKDDLHAVWTEELHFLMNGEGEVIPNESNPNSINPYGIIPFVYVRESDNELIPISDDDLLRMQIVICLLLTDLAFASKYQAWSIIALINASTEKLSFNPNSIVSLESKGGETPDIKVIKPELDSDSLLRMIESLLGMLLTTKNLSVGSVTGQVDAQQAASGVAKILDQAESMEDREIQTLYFQTAEKELWNKFSKILLPKWIEQKLIAPDFVNSFSETFDFKITFPEQTPVISEKERVDIEVTKLNQGLTTKYMAIKAINPEYSTDEIEQVLNEIKKEEQEKFDSMLGDVEVLQNESIDGQV